MEKNPFIFRRRPFPSCTQRISRNLIVGNNENPYYCSIFSKIPLQNETNNTICVKILEEEYSLMIGVTQNITRSEGINFCGPESDGIGYVTDGQIRDQQTNR